MKRQLFVNLPVKSPAASQRFFRALGFEFNPQFTDETAACLVIEDGISHVMLLGESFFQSFTPHPVCDARTSTEVLVCISCESRAHVDDLINRAIAEGGASIGEPQEHEGFMYSRRFQDPDGHLWELMYVPGPLAA